MADQLFVNSVKTTLASDITSDSQTTMQATAATGFPAPSGSEYFMIMIYDQLGGSLLECVKCTNVSGVTCTIERGQEGSSAQSSISAGAILLIAPPTKGTFETLQAAIEANASDISDNTNNIATNAAAIAAKVDTATGMLGLIRRAHFGYSDTDTITMGPARYPHVGTSSQLVYWNSTITFEFGSAGSNAASTDLGANETHYVYLDDSAIVSHGSAELNAGCFINNTTEPTWNDAKGGRYNGADKCIFSVSTDGAGDIEVFYHVDNYVEFDDYKFDYVAEPPADTIFYDAELSIPAFANSAQVLFKLSSTNTELNYRVNGSSGATKIVGYGSSLQTRRVMTDSSQTIEVRALSTSCTVEVWTLGWYFPIGM